MNNERRYVGDDEREIETAELTPTRASAEARAEIQSAIIVAQKIPRSEETAYGKLIKSCERTSFAEAALYSFPRGNTEVTGPSVNMAREAARVWGNVRWGITMITDDEDNRTIEGWAYDLETNTKVSQQDTFEKIEYRKQEGWKKCDERGVRELTSRRGAFLIRNSILQIIPKDFIDDAMRKVNETLSLKVKKDPEGEKKKIILAFGELNVPVTDLEEFLGQSLSSASPEQIKKLRGIWQSIHDGNSVWKDYFRPQQPKPQEAGTGQPEGDGKGSGRRRRSSTNDAPPPKAGAANPSPAGPEGGAEVSPKAGEEPERGAGPYVNDQVKGMLHVVARKYKWEVGAGSKDDPFHRMLMKRFGIDTVTRVRQADAQELVKILEAGPQASNFDPVG